MTGQNTVLFLDRGGGHCQRPDNVGECVYVYFLSYRSMADRAGCPRCSPRSVLRSSMDSAHLSPRTPDKFYLYCCNYLSLCHQTAPQRLRVVREWLPASLKREICNYRTATNDADALYHVKKRVIIQNATCFSRLVESENFLSSMM